MADEQVEILGLSLLGHFLSRNSSIIASSSFPVEDLIFNSLSKDIWQRSKISFLSIFGGKYQG